MEKLDYQPVGMPSDSKSIDVGQTQNLNSNILVHFNEKHFTSQKWKKAVYNLWLSTCQHDTSLIHCHFDTSLIHCHLITFKTVNIINCERDR